MATPATGPRCPGDEQEAYAWGFMLGYLGSAPDLIERNFPGIEAEPTATPEWLTSEEARAWSEGYETGVAVYCDHAYPEDRE